MYENCLGFYSKNTRISCYFFLKISGFWWWLGGGRTRGRENRWIFVTKKLLKFIFPESSIFQIFLEIKKICYFLPNFLPAQCLSARTPYGEWENITSCSCYLVVVRKRKKKRTRIFLTYILAYSLRRRKKWKREKIIINSMDKEKFLSHFVCR